MAPQILQAVCCVLVAVPVAGNLVGEAKAGSVRGYRPLVASALSREHLARQSLNEVLEVALGKDNHLLGEAHLHDLEDKLQPIYKALPKNRHGLLGHSTVRYALHRHFVQQHGMYVNGLEPGSTSWTDSSPTADILENRVPAYVQRLFENRLEQGFAIDDLALLASTLEHFIHLENVERLKRIFHLLGLKTDSNAKYSKTELREGIEAYAAAYIAGLDPADATREDLLKLVNEGSLTLPNWADNLDFVREEELNVLADEGYDKIMYFSDAEKVVRNIQEHFGAHQDRECQEMTKHLLAEEEGNTGRLKLSNFHRMSWHFSESADALQALGALDTRTKSSEPLVIIANYMASSTNCMATSSIYSVCCVDGCEHVLQDIEAKVDGPTMSPAQLWSVIVGLRSTSRPLKTLTDTLRLRLDEIAAKNGGTVPIHGRLFAQWLHHVFPQECKYPFRSGEHPNAAADFIAEQEPLSDEEFAAKLDQSNEENSLPWDTEEELVYNPETTSLWKEIRVVLRAVAGIGALYYTVYGLARAGSVARKKHDVKACV